MSIFSLFRIWFLIRLGDLSSLISLPTDVLIAFMRGIQYDTMVICYFLAIPFLIYFAGIFIKNEAYFASTRKFISWFCLFMLALSLVVLFIDQYYYNYFQTHISVIIFGLADDDSQTVMSSVWTDYPVIRLTLVWIGLIVAYFYYSKKVYSLPDLKFNYPRALKVGAIISILAFYSVGIRGSLGTFPLQMHDSQVSENKFINFLTINGIYALKNSYVERKKSANLIQNELGNLSALGYSNPLSAAHDFFPADSANTFSEAEAYDKLFETTPKNTFLEKNKPNVVFVFMESMSNYNMKFDSEKMNLLGNLRKHFQSDLVFSNFVSSGNITIQSLEYLMVNSPVSLSQTKYRFTQFPSSVAIPFKNAGYETNFITGGKVNWRSMDEFAAKQQFDEIKGMEHIDSSLKNCKSNKWGVYDEYLFDYVYDKISAKKSTPGFYFIQTTTNHTPFELPSDYKPYPIAIPDSLKPALLVNEQLAIKNLNAFQYSNNSLGTFLDKIKNSSLGKNTIVVVTGDHNNLMLFDFDEAHQLQQRGVPLYMYVPEKYKSNSETDLSRFGSHKDIFPTIFNLALSNAKYYSLGNNLLDSKLQTEDHYYGMNIGSATAFSANAAVNYSSSTAFYNWKDKDSKVLAKISKSAKAEQLLKRSRSNYALSMFYILDQINQQGSRITKKKPIGKKEKIAQL
ncbi:MAG: sulfatase-like hydrolase/transferase [Pyrinomonadaceae bacterium]|nr:sulfatase-like hydrolase/transferase [Sphingobacteriaceae bacterium]